MTAPDAGQGRVLVVEDDPAVRQTIVDSLELEGYVVRAAPDGQAALRALDEWRPDLIVLDLMMPVMNGWEFRAAQLARADLRTIPVILVSASRHLDARTELMDPAATVPKPFDLDLFLDTVARVRAGG